VTAEVVNLRARRKAAARAADRATADANAAKHGRTKAEKARDRALADKSERELDGHRRETPES
jgi:hypothetical protein